MLRCEKRPRQATSSASGSDARPSANERAAAFGSVFSSRRPRSANQGPYRPSISVSAPSRSGRLLGVVPRQLGASDASAVDRLATRNARRERERRLGAVAAPEQQVAEPSAAREIARVEAAGRRRAAGCAARGPNDDSSKLFCQRTVPCAEVVAGDAAQRGVRIVDAEALQIGEQQAQRGSPCSRMK